MRHRANPKFWKFYEQLPKEIQELADANHELLKSNPRHPSLHFKKVGRMWSARVGIIIAPPLWKMVLTSFGFGLAIIVNTTD